MIREQIFDTHILKGGVGGWKGWKVHLTKGQVLHSTQATLSFGKYSTAGQQRAE